MIYAFFSLFSSQIQKVKPFLVIAILIIPTTIFVIGASRNNNQRPVHTRQMAFYVGKEYLAAVTGFIERKESKSTVSYLQYQVVREIAEEERIIEQNEITRRNASSAGNPQRSVYVLEARDINDYLLLSAPLSLVAPGDPRSDEIGVSFQQQWGIFHAQFILPRGTSYMALVVRKSGEILHISYLEDWTELQREL